MQTNAEFIQSLASKALLRPAYDIEQNTFLPRLDSGLLTRQGLVEMVLASPELKGVPSHLSAIYQAIYSEYPSHETLNFWANVVKQGATYTQVAEQMATAPAVAARYPNLASLTDIVQLLYQNTLARAATETELGAALDRLDRGFSLGDLIVSTSRSPEALSKQQLAIEKNLLWHAVIGDQPTAAELAALPDDYAQMAVALLQMPEVPLGDGAPFWEVAGVLYAATTTTTGLTIDLAANRLTNDGTSPILTVGSIASAQQVNVSQMSLAEGAVLEEATQLINVLGDAADNTIVGSSLGDRITAAQGNDTLVLGVGSDAVYFADSAAANGLDRIDNFALGKDVLNFASFLNKTKGVVNLVSVDANKGFESAWSSGDLLAVNGFGLDSAQAVADLFGAGNAIAAPNGLSKAVVMTASISGDAKLWFVVNETDLGRITANEVQQVANLTGINNLLEQATIDSLRASVTVTSGPSVLMYSSGGLVESLNNDGSISGSITISIVDDTFTGAIGAAIGEVTNVPAGLKAKLIKTSNTEAVLSFTGKASAHGELNSVSDLTVTFVEDNFLSGRLPLNAVKEDLTLELVDVFMLETSGSLSVVGGVPSALTIDLTADTAKMGTTSISPLAGSLANATLVDLSGVTNTTATATLTVNGSERNEVFSAAPMGGSLRGAAGVDGYLLGSGVDKLVFEASAAANGIDVVGGGGQTNFKIGTGGDVLDFSPFLNVTSKTNIATRAADSTNAIAWANGQVLVVQGDGIDSASEIAGLFGAGSVFAAPTAQAKAVVIAADLVGDASVWYVTNRSNVTSIEASEVEQVAILTGINNVSLLPFVAANFA